MGDTAPLEKQPPEEHVPGIAIGASEGASLHTARRSRLARFFGALGPGLVTGAADDDPSGIATYSQAGATYGNSMLWTVPLTLPLMMAV
ncbi:hypothetical protein ACFVUP_37690, partial [Streptomyces bacillaris]